MDAKACVDRLNSELVNEGRLPARPSAHNRRNRAVSRYRFPFSHKLWALFLVLPATAAIADDQKTTKQESLNTPFGSRNRPSTENKKSDERKQEKKKELTPKEKLDRARLIRSVERGLGQMPLPGKKKSADDYWIVGTAELRLADRHADVRFDSRTKQKEIAEFLADYVLDAPDQTLRQWHVFSRFKTSAEADQALAELRQQYDAVSAYREQLAKIYRASSMTRC